MGSILMYELMAEERATRYRVEAEQDRRIALLKAQKTVRHERGRASERRGSTAPQGSTATRRSLAAAFIGFASMGALRRRRVAANR
ncbi:MAG TPA: hypothetical protein VKW09_10450 [bacterium]|nr:hypothetical protein [bacterium]